MAGVEPDAEGEEEERQGGEEFEGEGAVGLDKVRKQIAAAGFEVGGAVGGADEEAGEGGAAGLGSEVEGCAGEGGEAGEEGGEGYGWVEVGAGYWGLFSVREAMRGREYSSVRHFQKEMERESRG